MNIKQHFILGDQWLYFKLYTGFNTADLLLTEVIFPLTQYLKRSQLVSHWFYIRYNDPDFHLRIRFYLTDSKKIGEVVIQIHNVLNNYFKSGLIWKIQYDTYNREIERYGENTIEISEHIFYADSEMIVKLLEGLQENESEKQRWLLSLRATDELLNAFEFSSDQKRELFTQLKNSFYKEFHIEGNYKKQFSLNYRENRKDIEKVMRTKADDNSLLPIFQKKEMINPYAKIILELKNGGSLRVPLNDLLSSHIHMMFNRFFRTQQRKHELVIYDYLFRYYDSDLNRMKYQSINSTV